MTITLNIIIIMYLLILLILKPNRQLTFCGIASVSLKSNLTLDQCKLVTSNLKLLGVYNKDRGIHGCGLLINKEVHKGYQDHIEKTDTREFDDFIANFDFIVPTINPEISSVAILHTRQATTGAQTKDNNHPFFIKSIHGDKNDFHLVHNGTISNIWSLCNKNDIPHVDLKLQVDSHALGYLIDRVGVQVLEEYEGYAALCWNKVSEPNALYIYHGQSRELASDKEPKEERPMYFLETDEAIYFSSLWSSLNAIRSSEEQVVYYLEYNKVFKVINGKFQKKCTVIDRDNKNIKAPAVQHWNNVNNNNYNNYTNNTNRSLALTNTTGGVTKDEVPEQFRKTNLVFNETKPRKADKIYPDIENLYFWKGRFYRNGDNTFCHGMVFIKERGIISNEIVQELGAVPHYFFRGVRLNNETDYKTIVSIQENIPTSWLTKMDANFAYEISKFSMYPVCNMENEFIGGTADFKNCWYFKGIRATVKLGPAFCSRNYNIKEGYLVDITTSHQDDKPTIKKEPIIISFSEVSLFDELFKDVNECMEMLSDEHIKAIEAFVSATYQTQGIILTEDQLNINTWMPIKRGIDLGYSIRTSLEDTEHHLDTFLEMIEEDKKTSARLHNLANMAEADDLPFDREESEQGFTSFIDLIDESVKNDNSFPNTNTWVETEVEELLSSKESEQETNLAIIASEELIDVINEVEGIQGELSTNKSELAIAVSKETNYFINTFKKGLDKVFREFKITTALKKINERIES